MDDISNRTLALLLVAAVVVSLAGTIVSLNRLNQFSLPTGRAESLPGRVNLTVETSLSLALKQAAIDFGTGFVNTSDPLCATNATVNASSRSPSSNDRDNCWVSTTATNPPGTIPTGFIVENDGNVNISVQIEGPHPDSFFNYTEDTYEHNLTWRSYDENSSCAVGLQGAWKDFTSADYACDNLVFEPSDTDQIEVEVTALIPSNVGPGEKKSTSIIFTALST